MFASCHFGSSIDAASANYKSGRHIASAMGKRAGQAPVLKRPAAKMCSQPRASQPGTVPGYASDSMHTASTAANFDAQRLASGGNALGAAVAELSALSLGQLRARATSLGVARRDESKRQKRRNQLEEDCRLALEAQQSEVQQEGRRSGSALDVGGSSFAGASSLSAAPACGQEAERTQTAPGYASDSMHTASTAANFDAQGLASGGNALGAAVAELSALSLGQLRARATSLGVAHRDESKRQKRRNQLEEDCRLALEAQQSEVQQEARRSGSALDVGGSSFAGASSLSATPACGQEAERTKTVPGYASASMHTASTAANFERPKASCDVVAMLWGQPSQTLSDTELGGRLRGLRDQSLVLPWGEQVKARGREQGSSSRRLSACS